MLFGRRRSYLRKAAVAPIDGICSGDIIVIEAITNKLSPRLLPFVIQSDALFAYAVEKSAGSLSPRVKWEKLAEFEFELPSMSMQEELATLLWSAQKTKARYRNLLLVADDLVKSQFVEMIERSKLDGCSEKAFIEFAEFDTNMTTDFERYADFPHIGIDSIEPNTGYLTGYRTVSEDNVKSGKYFFNEENVIYSKIRPALNKVALPDFEGLCSADAYPLKANPDVCTRVFLAQILRSKMFLDYIIPMSSRSRMPKVNKEQLAGFKISLPSLSAQESFTSFSHQVDKSKFELQKALDDLNAMTKKIVNQELGLGNV